MAFMWAWATQDSAVSREDDDVILMIVNAYISLMDRRAIKYDSDVDALEHIAGGEQYDYKFIVGEKDIIQTSEQALEDGYVDCAKCGGTFGFKRFDKDRTAIKKLIAHVLSTSVAERYLPIQIAKFDNGTNRKGEGLYKIDIPSNQISIINAYW